MEDISKLTKKELEELGREHGVELDRRKKKDDLVEELREVVGDTPVQEEEAEVITEQAPVDDNFYTDRREAIKVVRKSGGRVKAVEGGFKIIRRKRRR